MLYTVLLTQVKPTLQQDNYLPRETKHLLLSTQRHHCNMLEILSTSLVWLTVMYFKHLANSAQHPPFLIVTATVQLWNMQYLHSPITSFNMRTAVKDAGVTLDESLFLFSFSQPPLPAFFPSKCVLRRSCTFISYQLRVTVETRNGAKTQGHDFYIAKQRLNDFKHSLHCPDRGGRSLHCIVMKYVLKADNSNRTDSTLLCFLKLTL